MEKSFCRKKLKSDKKKLNKKLSRKEKKNVENVSKFFNRKKNKIFPGSCGNWGIFWWIFDVLFKMKNKIEMWIFEINLKKVKKSVNISRRFRSNFRPFFFFWSFVPSESFFLSFSEFEFGEKIKIFKSVEIYNFFVKFFSSDFAGKVFREIFCLVTFINFKKYNLSFFLIFISF